MWGKRLVLTPRVLVWVTSRFNFHSLRNSRESSILGRWCIQLFRGFVFFKKCTWFWRGNSLSFSSYLKRVILLLRERGRGGERRNQSPDRYPRHCTVCNASTPVLVYLKYEVWRELSFCPAQDLDFGSGYSELRYWGVVGHKFWLFRESDDCMKVAANFNDFFKTNLHFTSFCKCSRWRQSIFCGKGEATIQL